MKMIIPLSCTEGEEMGNVTIYFLYAVSEEMVECDDAVCVY